MSFSTTLLTNSIQELQGALGDRGTILAALFNVPAALIPSHYSDALMELPRPWDSLQAMWNRGFQSPN